MRSIAVLLDVWRDHLKAIQDVKKNKRDEINKDLGFPAENIEGYYAYWYSEQFEGASNSNPYSAPRFYSADHSEAAEFYRLTKRVHEKVQTAYFTVILAAHEHPSQLQLQQVILLQLSNINQFLIQEAMPKLHEINKIHGAFSSMRDPERGPLSDILKNLRNWVRSTLDTLAQQLAVPMAAIDSPAAGVVVMQYQPRGSAPRLFTTQVSHSTEQQSQEPPTQPQRRP